MKRVIMLLLVGCLVVISQSFRTVSADHGDDDHGGRIPARALEGTYSYVQHGSLFFCVSATPPFPPAKCGSPGSLGFPLTIVDVGVTTGANGTGCSTLTETAADFPVDVSPPGVEVFHSVTKVTSYDPDTATGEASFTAYRGGQCHGTSFDDTGATVVSTGTEHFAATNRGKQIDVVITSLTNEAGSIGDFSLSGTAIRH